MIDFLHNHPEQFGPGLFRQLFPLIQNLAAFGLKQTAQAIAKS